MTPSSRITAGTNLSWAGNTLNATFTDTTNSNIPFLTVGNTGSLSFERAIAVSSPLTFTNGGANGAYTISVDANYTIPLTASVSNWESFYDTPSGRITAGTGFAWSGNTFGAGAGYAMPLSASLAAYESFYDTPSSRITAGTNLSWAGNTLNATFTDTTNAYKNRYPDFVLGVAPVQFG